MKFSESWLREWVNPKISTEELVEQLTMAGLEVDGVEPVAGAFSGVVVGEILQVEPHPNADKLRVCQVAGNDEQPATVVCGAPNARVGLKVPFATLGAKLPGDFKIKKAKLRGVESFGMLCGQTELEAGDDDNGLWELPNDAPVGEDFRHYLKLDDRVIEVDLTPNRSDCLGLQGLAREVGVLNRMDVNKLDIPVIPASSNRSLSVHLDAEGSCPRYVGRVIEGITPGLPSPQWLQEKLKRSDINPIDAIVDVTNYVLLELGQPMHAFDVDKLHGDIRVRFAAEGEKLTLLNDQEISLKSDALVIADEKSALALAGVMGGASSAVSDSTSTIFLEAAYFDPTIVAGKARSYGLHTDSSHRFERGVDYRLAEKAIERATALIIDIVGGRPGPLVLKELLDKLPAEKVITLEKARIVSGLGFAIPDDDVVEILSRLGLTLTEMTDSAWSFSIPSYRFDLSIEADLLEELARIYGYNNLPTTTCFIPQMLPTQSEAQLHVDVLMSQMIARDYREAVSYSFIDPDIHSLLFAEQRAVELLNPISSDMSVMRTSLLPGLLQTLSSNLKRQHRRIRIFERGLRFVPGPDGLQQKDGIAGLIYGDRDDIGWLSGKEKVDFFDMKADVEAMLSCSGREFSFVPSHESKHMHPGQTANICIGEELIGIVGAIHPEILKSLGLNQEVFVFEIDLAPVMCSSVPTYAGISRYPEVDRDLAFLVSAKICASELETAIAGAAGENLKKLKVFDIYSGEGIDSERKSIAFNLTFQHSSRTLTEEEVNSAVAAVVKRMEGDFNAALR